MVTTLTQIAKKQYYKEKFEACKSDLKRTWSIINSTIKPGTKNFIIQRLIRNYKTLTCPLLIAEALNDHFANIGITLNNALPLRDDDSFKKCLSNRLSHSIYHRPSTPNKVPIIIKELKNTKGNSVSFPENS